MIGSLVPVCSVLDSFLYLPLNPCVRILCAKESCFFFLSVGHCFSPIPECAVRNGAIFLKSLVINRPSCLHLTCTTRWHFKDITGNWLYWIYFLTFYWSIQYAY